MCSSLQEQRSPMDKALDLLNREVGETYRIIEILEKDFSNSRRLIENLKSDELLEVERLKEANEQEIRKSRAQLTQTHALGTNYLYHDEKRRQAEMKLLEWTIERKNEITKAKIKNLQAFFATQKNTEKRKMKSYEDYIASMKKQLKEMQKDAENIPKFHPAWKETTPYSQLKDQKPLHKDMQWISRVLNHADQILEENLREREKVQRKIQGLADEMELSLQDERAIYEKYIRKLEKKLCWNSKVHLSHCVTCELTNNDIETRRLIHNDEVFSIEKSWNYQKGSLKSLDNVLTDVERAKRQFWRDMKRIKEEIEFSSSISLSTPTMQSFEVVQHRSNLEHKSLTSSQYPQHYPSSPDSHNLSISGYAFQSSFNSNCTTNYSYTAISTNAPMHASNYHSQALIPIRGYVLQSTSDFANHNHTTNLPIAAISTNTPMHASNYPSQALIPITGSSSTTQDYASIHPSPQETRHPPQFQTPPYPTTDAHPVSEFRKKDEEVNKRELLNKVIEQQKFVEEVKKETESMSMADMMRRFGIKIDDDIPPVEPSREVPSQEPEPMDTSEPPPPTPPPTPPQSENKPQKKTLPQFEFLNRLPSSEEPKKNLAESRSYADSSENFTRHQNSVMGKVAIHTPNSWESQPRKEKSDIEYPHLDEKHARHVMNDTEKERPSKMDVQNRPQNSFLLSDQEPRQNRAQSSNHGRQGESSCFIPKVIPDAYEGNVSNTLKNHRDVRKGSEEAPQRQSSNQGTGHTERDYTASKYSTAGSQSQESSSSSRPRRVDNGYSGSVSNMPTGTSKFSQSLSQLSSQAGSLSRTRYEPQVQGGFSSGQDYQNYRFKDRQDYDRPSSGSHVISSIPEKKAMEDRKSVAEPLRILTDEDFHKKLQEDEAKRREETRRKNEEERLRRKKIQEERQREIEELRRQEQEIDEESTRNLAEFEENQAKEKIREEERRKKEEEETAKKNRLEEEERRKAEKSYDLMMAQVKRNMFVESKWDQWFGQLRGSVSHLISSLENVIFYVKTTDWKKAEVHLLSYNQEKILSVTGECKKLLANYQDQIDMIARLISRSDAPFLKDVKDNLERLSTLVRQLSGRLLLQEIDKIEFNTEEWTDIENLTKEVEKTARDIPSTYTLKQKYKNYTEKSKKPMKELRAISD